MTRFSKMFLLPFCIEIVKIWSVTQISWAYLFKKLPIPGSFLGLEVLSFNSYPY
jgi:hypothetical protein